MRFSLTNIGKIAQADIEINGLTVLGGYNDIGKSTINKMLFSVIKTISDIERESAKIISEQIEQEFLHLSERFKVIMGDSTLALDRYKVQGRDLSFVLAKLWKQRACKELIKLITLTIREELNFFQSNNFFDPSDGLTTQKLKELNELLDILEDRVDEIFSPDETKFYGVVFNNIAYSLFQGDIRNKNVSSTANSEVSLLDSYSEVKISLIDGGTNTFLVEGTPSFRDITLVDSRLVLGWSFMGRMILNHDDIFGRYVLDLLRKIRIATSNHNTILSETQRKLIDKIRMIIDGQMYYDNKQNNFLFKQEKITVKSINLASGIKTFGIIQMLLTSGTISANTVLIIDEPEAHLHPEWQLKYAEVLTQLVDMGVYVLVSTHSPYMIEALKHYSDKLQQEKITNFYLGNAGEHGTVFSDVTQNLDALFELLAKPMQRLAFES